MKCLLILVFLVSVIGCSVQSAKVNGAPPVFPEGGFDRDNIPKKLFKDGKLNATFTSKGNPLLFYWRTEGPNGEPFDEDEFNDAKAQLIKDVDDLEKEIITIKKEIAGIQVKEILPLVKSFVARKCGLYVDDLFGDLPDPNSTWVDEWKEPETPEEEKAIIWCQANQDSRAQVEKDKIVPLNLRQGKASLAILQSIGQENLVALGKIEISFSKATNIRLKDYIIEKKTFDSQHKDPFYQIWDVTFDLEQGLLSFTTPAISQSKDNGLIYYGEIRFALELSYQQNGVSIGGEFTLFDYRTKKNKKGRVSIIGSLK